VVEVASGRTTLAAQDVVGRGYDDAARRLVALGLVPARLDVERPGGDGSVVTASPDGRLPLGATVTLTVAAEPSTPGVPEEVAPAEKPKPPQAGKHHKPPKPPKGHGKRDN
jgi:hypothetical protein